VIFLIAAAVVAVVMIFLGVCAVCATIAHRDPYGGYVHPPAPNTVAAQTRDEDWLSDEGRFWSDARKDTA
jgi:hypothetical protein